MLDQTSHSMWIFVRTTKWLLWKLGCTIEHLYSVLRHIIIFLNVMLMLCPLPFSIFTFINHSIFYVMYWTIVSENYWVELISAFLVAYCMLVASSYFEPISLTVPIKQNKMCFFQWNLGHIQPIWYVLVHLRHYQ